MGNNSPEQKPDTKPVSELQKVMNRGCLGIIFITLLTVLLIVIEFVRTS